MTKRNKGFLVPETINPLGRRCVQLWIPDEQTHIANFWGVLNFLTLWTEYERTGNNDGALTADVWKEVYLTARQYFENGEGCYLPLELRNNGGMIEWRPDPNAAWTSLGDICPCPPVLTSPQYNPDGTAEQRACNIAVNLINWIMEKFNDALDQVELYADTISSFDAILALVPPAYLVADLILDMLNEVVEAGLMNARAFDTETVRDDMKRYLYCEMLTTGELTQEIWEGLIAWANAEYNHFPSGTGWAVWDYWARAFNTDAILSRARIESYEDADCTEFGCGYTWEHTTTFDDGTYKDWNVFGGRAMTPTTDGIESGILTTAPITRRQITLYNNMPYRDATTELMEMRFTYTDSSSGNSNAPGDYTFGNMRVLSAANGTGTILYDSGTKDIGAGDGNINEDGMAFSVPANASLLWYMQFAQRQTAPNVTGTGKAWQFRIRGNGKNPFVP